MKNLNLCSLTLPELRDYAASINARPIGDEKFKSSWLIGIEFKKISDRLENKAKLPTRNSGYITKVK